MMNKKYWIILTLAFVSFAFVYCSFCSATPVGETATEGDFEYTVQDDGTALIKRYLGSGKTLVIPSSLGGRTVTRIATRSIYGYGTLESVTLPNTITTIEGAAFFECWELRTINIPDSVTRIISNPFPRCSKLEEIVISPDQPYYEMNDCLLIEKTTHRLITFLSTIGPRRIDVPEGVMSIGAYAFYECPVVSVRLPNSVVDIGYESFWGCGALTEINIPDSVTTIGNGAFRYCEKLQTISIPASVTSIGKTAFNDCSALRSINVTYNSYAEEYCKEIEWLNYNYTYRNSDDYRYVLASDGTAVIVGYSGEERILSVPSHLDGIEVSTLDCAFSNSRALTEVTLPNTITSIGFSAFYYCQNLSSITIPASVITIGKISFGNCSALTSIRIPDSVKTIDKYAFSYCTSLTDIAIPNSVISIEDDAFKGCSGLSRVTFSEGINVIGDRAFADCTSLTELIIPNGAVTIGNEAFSGCACLKNITIPDSITSIGEAAFNDCPRLTSINAPTGSYAEEWAKTHGFAIGINRDTDYHDSSIENGQSDETSRTDSATENDPSLEEEATVIENETNNRNNSNEAHVVEYDMPDKSNPKIELDADTPFSQQYWVVFKEGFRNSRIEASTFDLNLSETELSITWDTGLDIWSSSQSVQCSQYYLTERGNWEKIGTYYRLSDYAIDVIGSNLNIIDSDGMIILPNMDYSTVLRLINGEQLIKQDGLIYRKTAEGVIITGYIGRDSKVIIPSEIENISVIQIAPDAFNGDANLVDIEIPDNVQYISNHAFDNSSNELTIYCHPDSCAEGYAKENNVSYKYIRDSTTYYFYLRSSKEQILLNDPQIYNAVIAILIEDGVNEGDAENIVNRAKTAPETFSNLYVWSIYDYTRTTDTQAEGSMFEHDNRRMIVTDPSIVELWFHESGHAIDFSLNGSYCSVSSTHCQQLSDLLKDAVRSIIFTQVGKAAEASSNSIPDTVIEIITSEILGPGNPCTPETEYKIWQYGPLGIRDALWYNIPRPSSVEEQYNHLWEQSLMNIAEYCDYNMTFEEVSWSIWSGYENSIMLTDMISGFTNNTVNSKAGHGYPFQQDWDDPTKRYYWYTETGEITYYQNLEAWAEYFSSKLTGSSLDQNRAVFTSACDYMDDIAKELLEGYIQKHSGE